MYQTRTYARAHTARCMFTSWFPLCQVQLVSIAHRVDAFWFFLCVRATACSHLCAGVCRSRQASLCLADLTAAASRCLLVQDGKTHRQIQG